MLSPREQIRLASKISKLSKENRFLHKFGMYYVRSIRYDTQNYGFVEGYNLKNPLTWLYIIGSLIVLTIYGVILGASLAVGELWSNINYFKKQHS